ncbi:hypothetical protein [uncultured Nitrosomonas sp.]|uniref:hypothetical protein n=1 Tax=uncultured Nitrosomonas sp. TaxID=156424 RepID=UPI0025E65A38|nr:hypothetical protein [uncultured Nitrosomonas sp.]
MKEEGFPKFSLHYHAQLWQSLDAKNIARGFGALVAGKSWHWYDQWIEEVRKHCQANTEKYS